MRVVKESRGSDRFEWHWGYDLGVGGEPGEPERGATGWRCN